MEQVQRGLEAQGGQSGQDRGAEGSSYSPPGMEATSSHHQVSQPTLSAAPSGTWTWTQHAFFHRSQTCTVQLPVLTAAWEAGGGCEARLQVTRLAGLSCFCFLFCELGAILAPGAPELGAEKTSFVRRLA